VIERAVVQQLTHHLQSNHIFDEFQSGYRQHHSCETALVSVLDAAYSALDEKQVMLLVLLDMSSAFDSVDHQILSNRLKQCGIIEKAHSWIMSYLGERKQLISINGVTSAASQVDCGVPQGSALGPLLFVIYLTGLREIIAPHSINYRLYADDLQLFIPSSVAQLAATVKIMEDCIMAVKSWLESSLLTLNDGKTEFIILGTPPMLKKCPLPLPHLTIGNTVISCSSSCIRNLGVVIDPTLTFQTHISNTCAKSFSSLKLINRVRRTISTQHYSMLIHTLVVSNLDYCAPLLLGVPQNATSKLQSVLNAALKSILGLRKYDHISSQYKSLKWLSIDERIKYRAACLIYSVKRHNVPTYLRQLLLDHNPGRGLRSGGQNLLTLQRANSVIGSRAFRVSAPALWNSLPISVRDSTSMSSFQAGLKKFLLDVRGH
jgi:hypothetical protein